MSIEIYHPGDYIYDNGDNGRIYPIEEWFDLQEHNSETEIMYDKTIQKTSYIQANIVAVFEEWFKSFFSSNYFKFTRLRTQSTFGEFKSFMQNIYKKDMPFLIIDPHSPEHVEDSIFGLNMINRYNEIDPQNDNIGAILLYAEPVICTDSFELYYRRNTFRFEFDIMIMEQTLDRQINMYNKLLMGIRHNSKFSFERSIPSLIPSSIIKNIANLFNLDYRSQKFLDFLNERSMYPIIRRIIPNKQLLFFIQHKVMINVEVPSLPSKDSVETAEQIEWGARIVDNFIFNVILPSEFLFLMPKHNKHKYMKGIPEDPDSVYFISPIHSDIEIPSIIDGFKLVNRLDIMINHEDDNILDLLPIIDDIDSDIGKIIRLYIHDRNNIDDIIKLTLYSNGSYKESSYNLSKTGEFMISNPIYDKLYCLNIYINLNLVNMIKTNIEKTYIGTIEKY